MSNLSVSTLFSMSIFTWEQMKNVMTMDTSSCKTTLSWPRLTNNRRGACLFCTYVYRYTRGRCVNTNYAPGLS